MEKSTERSRSVAAEPIIGCPAITPDGVMAHLDSKARTDKRAAYDEAMRISVACLEFARATRGIGL